MQLGQMSSSFTAFLNASWPSGFRFKLKQFVIKKQVSRGMFDDGARTCTFAKVQVRGRDPPMQGKKDQAEDRTGDTYVHLLPELFVILAIAEDPYMT